MLRLLLLAALFSGCATQPGMVAIGDISNLPQTTLPGAELVAFIDDDIVAKQLREAALAEEDPELRERLWEEYRKYKGL